MSSRKITAPTLGSIQSQTFISINKIASFIFIYYIWHYTYFYFSNLTVYLRAPEKLTLDKIQPFPKFCPMFRFWIRNDLWKPKRPKKWFQEAKIKNYQHIHKFNIVEFSKVFKYSTVFLSNFLAIKSLHNCNLKLIIIMPSFVYLSSFISLKLISWKIVYIILLQLVSMVVLSPSLKSFIK